MSSFGCYTMDRLYCNCGECPACVHREQMEKEKRSERVMKAVGGFFDRVTTGKYVSPEEQRAKARREAKGQ